MTDAQRAALADELEMRGSPLCDCAGPPPVSALTGGTVAHRCECAAVRASALVRRAASRTRHAAECGCGLADDLAGRFWDEAGLRGRPSPGTGAC
ncbi:hypothetical protein SMC26_03600 [Actinomadura fulvescens]|uniref:Uncharacterized protein n=1 Tax=Actinomadura fulvescens TaxID=46160 RepID=A0ABN3PWA7_9ACTN